MVKKWAGLFIMGLATLLQAGQRQDLSTIYFQAKHFLEKRLTEQFRGKIVVKLEQQGLLATAPCEKTLKFFLPSTKLQSQMSVGIRCENELTQGWSLFIPAAVQLKRKVVVARRDIPQGVSIQVNDLALQERDIIPLNHGYFETLDLVLGQTTQMTVAANMPLSPRALRSPSLIKRSQAFRIIAQKLNLDLQGCYG